MKEGKGSFLAPKPILDKSGFHIPTIPTIEYPNQQKSQLTQKTMDTNTNTEEKKSPQDLMTRYEIIESQGCTAFGLWVNGEEFYDLEENKQEEIVDYIFVKLKEAYKDKEVGLADLLHNLPPHDHQYDPTPCDQCGDSVSETTWKI